MRKSHPELTKKSHGLRKAAKRLFLIFLLAPGFVSLGAFAQAEAADGYLARQLSSIARFCELQSLAEGESVDTVNKIDGFVKTFSDPDFSDEKTSENLIEFCKLAFSGSTPQSGSLLRALQLGGHLSFTRSNSSEKTEISSHPRHFSGHVREAIIVNKARSDFYRKRSNGKTSKLSRLYTNLEYAILPLATLIDRWAAKLNQAGIPVLTNDFAAMTAINPAETPVARTGVLCRDGQAEFSKLLDFFQTEISRAARHKDFLKAQLQAIKTLHDLRRLELQHNCNLALSIHFVESIGLAARNAQRLSQTFNGRSDNFYRVFILLQNAGIKMFAKVDLKAQPFHRQQIGIIVNDLPAIPFP